MKGLLTICLFLILANCGEKKETIISEGSTTIPKIDIAPPNSPSSPATLSNGAPPTNNNQTIPDGTASTLIQNKPEPKTFASLTVNLSPNENDVVIATTKSSMSYSMSIKSSSQRYIQNQISNAKLIDISKATNKDIDATLYNCEHLVITTTGDLLNFNNLTITLSEAKNMMCSIVAFTKTSSFAVNYYNVPVTYTDNGVDVTGTITKLIFNIAPNSM